jgi:hypothetical protein
MYAHKLLLTEKSPADLHLTNGFSSCPEWLPRIEPSESSRTLGVHLSPSGCQKHLCQVLWHHAKFYCDRIASSYVTPTEAFLSYFLYIRPKINYPLSCTGLTTVQCRFAQAPTLEGLLPKLHLNRHSPRAVLFAGPKLGGLNLPGTTVNQGLSQLTLLIGHTKLGDETGNMIRSFTTHLQLLIGSLTPFSQLSFPLYEKWIDQPFWLTFIWSFLHRAHASFDIEHMWVPSLARQNDVLLMDLAIQLNFTSSQLKQINLCRLYLQVLMLSDIATADGRKVLQSALG